MKKQLTDEEIIEKSEYSLDFLNKLKAEDPNMFTSKKWRDLRRKILNSRQKYYYAINNTKIKEEREKLKAKLPRYKPEHTTTIPDIIKENCGTSRVLLNAFKQKNPDLFSEEKWHNISQLLRKQQGIINSANYRLRKAHTVKPDLNTPMYSANTIKVNSTELKASITVTKKNNKDSQNTYQLNSSSNTELASQTSSSNDSEYNSELLELLMPCDYDNMSLTDTDFNLIDSANNLFWQPTSP